MWKWEDRCVLVTGAGGFLGRCVVEKLRERGCGKVWTPSRAEFDLRYQESVSGMFGAMPSEIVIHLAAEVGGIGANQAHPGKFFYENLVMGAETMEQARRAGVVKFVAVGTVCCYPKFTKVPFREEDLWSGYPEETNAPYGLAKKMLLVQAQAYRKEYGFNGIFLLPVNLFGPGDNFDPESSHVIPALIRKFVAAKRNGAETMVAWGSGEASREFLYVDDAAEGIVMATELYDGADPVNLGSGNEIRIRDLAALIASEVGFEGRIEWDSSRPDGQPRRYLDTSRAFRAFGFRSKVDLKEGIRRTVRWYTDGMGSKGN